MITLKNKAYDFLMNEDYSITKEQLVMYIFNFFPATKAIDFVNFIKGELDIDEDAELIDDSNDSMV